MRQYTLRIELIDPESEDLSFTLIRHNDVVKTFTDTLMVGLERAKDAIAADYSEEPL